MMKRKQLDEVNHDFSDFSISSPATKIRRLDAELAPIMEEEESQTFHQSTFPQQQQPSVVAAADELAVENEERAIVLFNPNNNHNNNNHLSPSLHSTFSLTPHILSRLKSQGLWSKHSNLLKLSEEEGQDDTSEADPNQCLAVIPWVQSYLPPAAAVIQEPPWDVSEMMMEAEDNDQAASMDIEDDNQYSNIEQRPAESEFGVGFNQWQQQHCMVPSHLPQNAPAAPVVWFR